jgi:predicted nucleic-acid-binding Zn-ribbon protein
MDLEVQVFIMDVYLESLYHFSCSNCSEWWSTADIKPKVGSEVYCPHCGNKNKVDKIVVSTRVFEADNYEPERVS